MDRDHASLASNRAVPHRIEADTDRLPFIDGSFDLITANMVIEHLADPAAALREVQRVLKPGGVFLCHTPNLLNPMTLIALPLSQPVKNLIIRFLEGRPHEDVFPTRYRLNRPKTIRRVAEQTGLVVDELSLIESSPETLMLGPLVVFEMLFIRLTRLSALRGLRSNIIAAMRKPNPAPITPAHTPDLPRLTPRPDIARAA